MRNNDESMPRVLPVETVVLRSVGKKEVGAFTGKEIREAIERAGVHAQADYTVHRNDKANALQKNSCKSEKFARGTKPTPSNHTRPSPGTNAAE